MRVENQTKSKKRKKSNSGHGLLAKLVDSHFYQVLIGQASVTGPWVSKPKPNDKKQGAMQQSQSISSMAIDIVLFAILVMVAPFFTIAKAVFRFINEYWVIKFLLGVLSGLICIMGIYLLVQLIFGWPNFSLYDLLAFN